MARYRRTPPALHVGSRVHSTRCVGTPDHGLAFCDMRRADDREISIVTEARMIDEGCLEIAIIFA